MREVPYVSFPHVTPGAYTALRNHGEICILNRSDGHVGLRFRGHTDAPATLLVFEAGRIGAEAFKRWCDENREQFGRDIKSIALVPHKLLVPAPEYVEE